MQGVKLGLEYKLRFQLALQHGDDLPQTPDPTERTSKREWEDSFGKWRKALQDWNPEGPPGLRQIDLGRRCGAGVPRRAEAEKPEHDERRARSELQSDAVAARTGATWLVDIPQPVPETGNAEQAPASFAAEQRQATGASAKADEPAWPKNFIPATCPQEMCTIYLKLFKEYVDILPLRYGRAECLVSHHDLRTLWTRLVT